MFRFFTILAISSPIDTNVNRRNEPLSRRDEGRPLWGPDGPKPEDIKKDGLEDDWFLTGAAAIANTKGSSIIQDIFTLEEKPGTEKIESVIISLYSIKGINTAEKDGVAPEPQKQSVKFTDVTDKFSGSNDHWWIAALEYAAMQTGGDSHIKSDGFKKQGGPLEAWLMITGKHLIESKIDRKKQDWQTELWEPISKVPENYYMCIKSVSNPTDKIKDSITSDTWYAVLGHDNDEIVTLFDVKKGADFKLPFQDLKDNVGWIVIPKEN
ncbi:uncharacterized protein L201_003394 [Kwoniella dendrophila CBS 6074]|uniref:Calpain catalytic domain-containing protein n=1 Tax=Kwoniella dendrophila CBS 6074 TaxID=1295534 RepID=A0AAX4JVD7_9TREE